MESSDRTKKIKRALILAACLVGAGSLFCKTDFARRWYIASFADFPENWEKIKPGMVSRDARSLLGKPEADGRGLKVVDRWRQNKGGVEMHLDLWFDEGSHEDGIISRVVTWKRAFGRDFDKTVDPPWDEE